jgi:ferredoxin-NADP reductase
LRVTRVEPESASIVSLHLAAPDGAPLPGALPGQFLTMRLHPTAGGPSLIRSYSLSGPPDAPAYRISVKQEPHGAASSWLGTQVRAGDTLEVAAPRGAFTLRGGDQPILLLSAGVGATPLLAMLHALAAARTTRTVWWLHGARNRREHAFAREVQSLLAGLPNAHAHVRYSRPGPADGAATDAFSSGRLSAELLRTLDVPRDADAYLCGPAAFMDELSAALVAHGLHPSRVRTELFGARPALTPGVVAVAPRASHPPDGPTGTGPAVAFARSGLTVPWDERYASLLELAEACSVPARWSCRTGVCHNCEIGLLAGGVTYDPQPIDAPAAGNVLTCCSRPMDDVILDL